MPATMVLRSFHGPVPDAGEDVTAVRFKLADNDALDLTVPVTGPAIGTAYSWIKNLRLTATTPPMGALEQLRLWSDGSNSLGTGITVLVRTSDSYVDPIVQGSVPLAGMSDLFGYSSAAPLQIPGQLAGGTAGSFGDWLQLQLAVNAGATVGLTPTEILTISYDEY